MPSEPGPPPTPDDATRRAFARTIPGELMTPAAARDDAARSGAAPAPDHGSAPQLVASPRLESLGEAWRADGTRFTVGERLGAGSTATVYSVRDHDLERDVAIKVLSLAAAHDHGEVAAFIAEARTTATLAHPNVLPVHDIAVAADGRPYFTMGRVIGRTLADAIEASLPTHREACVGSANAVVSILIAVGNAAAYAHHRRLVHQDIKPANILIGDFGEVLLLDWGSASRWPSDRARLYGTPLYMSPEQARREAPTPASDVFCLGATLFHALLLRIPTWSDDPEEFWRRKARGEIDAPTPVERAAHPPGLLAIALKAISARPADRYADAEGFVADLERFQAGQALVAYREPLSRLLRRWYAGNRRVVWTAAVALLLIAAAAGAWWREKLKERSSWREVYADTFATGDARDFARDWVGHTRGWNSDWVEQPLATSDTWRLVDGGVIAQRGDGYADLSFRRKVLGDLRVEWTYTALNRNENLNCFIGGEDRDSGYTCHIGGWSDPTLCVLSRGDPPLWLAHLRRDPIEIARPYRFALQREEHHITLTIDGATVFDWREYDDLHAPSGSGFGFDCCVNGSSRIADVRIWHRPLAERISPLAVGNRLYQIGNHVEAARAFAEVAESYPGSDLEAEARYKHAIAQAAAGDVTAALTTLRLYCAAFPRDIRVPMALTARSRLARQVGDAAEVAALDDAMLAWPQHPALAALLTDLAVDCDRQLDQAITARFLGHPVPGPEVIPVIHECCAAIDAWRAKHRFVGGSDTFRHRALAVLRQIGRNDLVLALAQDQNTRNVTLSAMGKIELQIGGALDYDQAMWRGDPAAVLAGEPLPWQAIEALVDLGDAEGLRQRVSDRMVRARNYLRIGRSDLVLAECADQRWAVGAALNDLGRHREVIDHYADALEDYGFESTRALCGLGRYRDAIEQIVASKVDAVRRGCLVAVAADAAGATAVADEFTGLVAAMPDTWESDEHFFAHFLFPRLRAALAGARIDLAGEWRDHALARREVLEQHSWHDAAYISGIIDGEAFAAQPDRRHLGMRRDFADAVRADLVGDRVAALTAYRRAADGVPRDGIDPVRRCFIAGRIARLTR